MPSPVNRGRAAGTARTVAGGARSIHAIGSSARAAVRKGYLDALGSPPATGGIDAELLCRRADAPPGRPQLVRHRGEFICLIAVSPRTHKEDRALRTETTINDARDFGVASGSRISPRCGRSAFRPTAGCSRSNGSRTTARSARTRSAR
jgi:hypothetical protein